MFLQLRAQVAYANGAENVVHHVFDSQGGTIGRDLHCQMVLQDPFRRISRIQAQIVFDGAQFALINASTSNPIYVDGQELSPGATCAVQHGSSWQTGNYTIVVEHMGEAKPTSATSAVVAPDQQEPDARFLQPPPAAQTQAVALTPADSAARGPFDDLLATPVKPPEAQIGRPDPWAQAEHAASNGQSTAPQAQPYDTAGTPAPDPFAQSAAPPPPTAHHFPEASSLGTDPFADLLATPISHQVAQAPLYTQQGATSHAPALIPEDFNPLALHGVSPRNTADPLSQLQSQQSVQEMFPERSMDAIFHPSEGNIGELTQDPLNANLHQGLMDASIRVDPMELFAHQASKNHLDPASLFSDPPAQAQAQAVSDHRVEVGAYFRAPRAYEPTTDQTPAVATPMPDVPDAALAPAPYSPVAGEQAHVPSSAGLTDGNSLESLFNLSSSPSDMDVFGLGAGVAPLHSPPANEPIAAPVAPVYLPEPPQAIPIETSPEAASHSIALTTAPPVSSPPCIPEPSCTTEQPAPADLGPGTINAAAQPQWIADEATHTPAPHQAPTTAVHLPENTTPGPNALGYCAEELLQSFKAGAGLSDCRYPEKLTPELMYMIGSMLGGSIQGCMDLLGSRAAAKQEVRVSVTLINAEANNPLKFLPTGASALAQIFGPHMPGFQAGPAAVDSAFQDLRGHEMAMMAGTQAAVRGLFERFSPKHLEDQLQAQGRAKALFASQRQARLWELYCSHYEWLKDEMKNQSPTAWGTEFLSAYQAEVSNNNEGQPK